MIAESGLLVFGQHGGPASDENDYDSRKPRLQVSLTDKPPKLAILDEFTGGSALVSNPAAQQREVLFTTPHKLKYTPEVFVYFYVKKYANSITDNKAGVYSAQALFYSGSSGSIEDKVFLEVDDKELRIVHTLDDFFFGGGYHSDAALYDLRIKFYICSNDSHLPAYTWQGPGI